MRLGDAGCAHRRCLVWSGQPALKAVGANPSTHVKRALGSLMQPAARPPASLHAYLPTRAACNGVQRGLAVLVCAGCLLPTPAAAAAWPSARRPPPFTALPEPCTPHPVPRPPC